MYEYPYDQDDQRGGNPREVLKACHLLARELMYLYEPFGQASSSYEDTGNPEITAIGIRVFLSVPSNIRMMKDIGKETLESIECMGCVAEQDKKYGTFHKDKKAIERWVAVIGDIKMVCTRTYDAIMERVRTHMKRMERKEKK